MYASIQTIMTDCHHDSSKERNFTLPMELARCMMVNIEHSVRTGKGKVITTIS